MRFKSKDVVLLIIVLGAIKGPLFQTTDFVETKAPRDRTNNWWVCPVIDGKEQAPGGKASLPANPPAVQYISIPFQGKYVCNKVAIADLNGDGQYDYVIKQPRQITDPGVWLPSTDTWKVEAYLPMERFYGVKTSAGISNRVSGIRR
jgi:rhamnogalacturonan endolyase